MHSKHQYLGMLNKKGRASTLTGTEAGLQTVMTSGPSSRTVTAPANTGGSCLLNQKKSSTDSWKTNSSP